MKKYTAIFAAALLLLCACGKNEGDFPEITTVTTTEITTVSTVEISAPAETSAVTTTTTAETSVVTSAATTSAVTTSVKATAKTTALTTSEDAPDDILVPIQYDVEPLSREALLTLLNEYADTKYTEERPITRNDVSVVSYYGTYDNGEVAVMTVGDCHTDDLKSYVIGEYEFILASGSYEMLLHTDVGFIEADEAYEHGLLTDEDAKEMYYYYGHQRDTELIPKLLNPITGDLTNEQIETLREDFVEYMRDRWENITLDDGIHILKYYGTYDSGEVVVMYSNEYAMTCDENRINIAGYEFYLESGSLELLLHTESGFIPAAEAYEQGLLSDNDIAEMHSHEGVYW